MRNKSLLLTVIILNIALCSLAQVSGTFKDSRDGKTYKTVKIGTQTWLASNLAFKAGSGCYEYDNNKANATIFGYLYTWETAKKVCPTGWHLPSMAEWTTLVIFAGGEKTAGNKLKEAGSKHWANPNTGATNESGFTALPSGTRSYSGFEGLGFTSFLWSSSKSSDGLSWVLNLNYDNAISARFYVDNKSGLSVRCLKDN